MRPPIGQPKRSAPAKAEPPHLVGLNAYDESTISAMRALASGEASKDQQVRALKWIVEVACATYQQPFIAGQSDSTAFMAGRMYAGQLIIKVMKINSRIVAKSDVDRENG